MELIVAEKPKAAGKIAYALKAKPKRMGKVTVYQGDHFTIAPAVGHLFVLAQKTKDYSYPVFDIEWKPIYEVNQKSYYTKPYVAVLKKLADEADEITVACDFDTEGTLIGYNVVRFLSDINIKSVGRMKFSTLTPAELSASYENRIEFDIGNAYAGELRHKLDWFYGINLSRALMSSLAKTNNRRIMSIGRVQGPALALVAERENEIKSFVPEPYWELHIKVKSFSFSYVKNPVKKEDEAKALKKKIKDSAKTISVKKEKKLVPPYPPFDLTSLQLEAARVFRFSPSKTLKLAQTLYEAGLISYPRTSSQKLPPSIGYKRILTKLSENASYSKAIAPLFEKPYLKPVEGRKEDPAHPAIYPTGQKGKIEGDELKLYDLIVKRFISLFYDFAEKQITNVLLDAGIEFKGKGVRLLKKGWISVYSFYKSDEKEIPEFEEGEENKVERKELKKKKTKPPSRFTSASLVSQLEKRKLGTKATRAVIVDTLYKRQYIQNSPIHLTEFGNAVYTTLKKYVPEILDENLTRRIEEEMEKVSMLELDPEKVLEDGKQTLLKILKEFKENELKIGEELSKNLPRYGYYGYSKSKFKSKGAKKSK